ncbi:MAG: T9SS type A sorting domain-containing protein [Saprospiraceae bacterium]|nr:T9SS type A sorting domain-containing protein [Saprospiraceae bacterium]
MKYKIHRSMTGRSRWLFMCLVPAALISPVAAQQIPLPVCGQEWVREVIRTHHPVLAERMEAVFEEARGQSPSRSGTFVIPTVIHIVWKNPEENLSDALIASQIEVLNQDFNRTNADAGDLRAIFAESAGSADIQFEVAAVQRVQTTKDFGVDFISGSLATDLKYTALGGSDAWDPEHYLNIWICKIQPIAIGPIVLGQILGFAYPPVGLSHWPEGANAPQPGEDGVVIDYRVWGPDNPYPVEVPGGTGSLVVKGRTPVHEVGHYLGLRHIWGDGGLLGPNDCAQSDGVDDTPWADSQSNFDCDKTRNTCTNIDDHYGADMPDMVENFMDYAREDCMNTFTKGQVSIMRNVLEGPRAGLVEGPAGLHPFSGAGELVAYPNPAGDWLKLEHPSGNGRAAEVRVTDLQGRVRVVQAVPAGARSVDLTLSALESGMYLAAWQQEGGETVRCRVVVR